MRYFEQEYFRTPKTGQRRRRRPSVRIRRESILPSLLSLRAIESHRRNGKEGWRR